MENLKINSKFDDLPLDVLISPCIDPKGIVQVAHGMCEYKERYLDFINYLNEAGYIVIIHDHRGHGKSILNEDDLGYFYDDSGEAIVEDTYQLTQYIKERYPNLPVYLFGHSMGSLVVRNYILKYDYEIAGLIVCGSPSKNPLANLGKLLCKIIIHVKGDRYDSKLLQKMSFGTFNKGYSQPNEWICSDLVVVDKYNHDPLCMFTFSINGFYNLLTLMQRTYQKTNHQVNTKLPILFIAGSDDPCIVDTKAFNQAVSHLKNCGYLNVSSKLFNKMRHEILNETNKKEVYQTIIDYLDTKN